MEELNTEFKERFPHSYQLCCYMCFAVGADPRKINFQKNRWWRKHTWTAGQGTMFREQAIQYLMNSKEARYEIMKWPRKHKASIAKVVDEFIWNYGWLHTQK